MEQYNLLLIHESPELMGLSIMRTNAYKKLIEKNPGLIHDNLGDFFSNVSCNNLADTIYKILGSDPNRKSMDWLEVVDTPSFDKMAVDRSSKRIIDEYQQHEDGSDTSGPNVLDYLIKGEDGIRFYFPILYVSEGPSSKTRVEYFFFISKFIEKLFAEEREGSLQAKFKRVVE